MLIVGAGPAGLATALAARQKGLTVTVLDRRPGAPADKACGEGLMPDGLAALERLGVTGLGGAPFRGIRYVDGDRVAEGCFPGHPGLGVRRLRLHEALARRAAATGVEVRWNTRVAALPHDPSPRGDAGDATFSVCLDDGERLTARWIVGADGLRSHVRRWAGLDAEPRRGAAGTATARFGVRRHYAVAPADLPDTVEVWWGEHCEAYVTPVADDEIGVAFLWSGRKAGFDELLADFPRLAARLEGLETRSRDRGAGPLRQPVKGVVRGNLALVGDAGGYVDAITGEGLSLAFHQATALACALAAGDLAVYAAAHRRIGRVPNFMTHLLLAVERRPWLRRRLVPALAADPKLFSRLLALHVGDLTPAQLGLGGVARLAGLLVTAQAGV